MREIVAELYFIADSLIASFRRKLAQITDSQFDAVMRGGLPPEVRIPEATSFAAIIKGKLRKKGIIGAEAEKAKQDLFQMTFLPPREFGRKMWEKGEVMSVIEKFTEKVRTANKKIEFAEDRVGRLEESVRKAGKVITEEDARKILEDDIKEARKERKRDLEIELDRRIRELTEENAEKIIKKVVENAKKDLEDLIEEREKMNFAAYYASYIEGCIDILIERKVKRRKLVPMEEVIEKKLPIKRWMPTRKRSQVERWDLLMQAARRGYTFKRMLDFLAEKDIEVTEEELPDVKGEYQKAKNVVTADAWYIAGKRAIPGVENREEVDLFTKYLLKKVEKKDLVYQVYTGLLYDLEPGEIASKLKYSAGRISHKREELRKIFKTYARERRAVFPLLYEIIEKLPLKKRGFKKHPNGGGLVEDVADVDKSVQVDKTSRVEGFAVVKGKVSIRHGSKVIDASVNGIEEEIIIDAGSEINGERIKIEGKVHIRGADIRDDVEIDGEGCEINGVDIGGITTIRGAPEIVGERTKIRGAMISGSPVISNSIITGTVGETAKIYDSTVEGEVTGNASVRDKSTIKGIVYDDASVADSVVGKGCEVFGDAEVDSSELSDKAVVCGDAIVENANIVNSEVFEHAMVRGESKARKVNITMKSEIFGYAVVEEDVRGEKLYAEKGQPLKRLVTARDFIIRELYRIASLVERM